MALQEYGKPGVGISAVARTDSYRYKSGAQAERAVAGTIRRALKGRAAVPDSGAVVVHDAPTPTPVGAKRYKANADHLIITTGRLRPHGLIVETKGWASGWYLAKWGGWRWTDHQKGRFGPADKHTIRLLLDRYREVLPGIQWSAIMVTTNDCRVLGASGYKQVSLATFERKVRGLNRAEVPERVRADVLSVCGNPARMKGR
jgi:hypothetical protein